MIRGGPARERGCRPIMVRRADQGRADSRERERAFGLWLALDPVGRVCSGAGQQAGRGHEIDQSAPTLNWLVHWPWWAL